LIFGRRIELRIDFRHFLVPNGWEETLEDLPNCKKMPGTGNELGLGISYEEQAAPDGFAWLDP